MELSQKRPWYRRVDWINLFYLVASPVGAVYYTHKYLMENGWHWGPVLVAMVLTGLTTLSVTACYHRFISHRSFEMKPWLKGLSLLLAAGAFQGSALKWGTDHRRHHRMVDTPDDPYNINQGFFWAHMGWLVMEDNPKYHGQFEKDLLADPWVLWQHRLYFPLTVLVGFGVPALIGGMMGSVLGGIAFSGFVRLVLSNHITFFINSFCHIIGTQPYTDKNSARDSFVMAVLAAGEGYHNFHHKFQSDYRNGIRWYHFDPTKWAVATASWLGWTENLRRTPAPMILRARLEMEEKRLICLGLPAEQLHPFREKVEEAQRRWRQLKEDYTIKKRDVQLQGHRKLEELRWEMKVAKAEFRIAWKQWCAYRRYPRLAPAFR